MENWVDILSIVGEGSYYQSFSPSLLFLISNQTLKTIYPSTNNAIQPTISGKPRILSIGGLGENRPCKRI